MLQVYAVLDAPLARPVPGLAGGSLESRACAGLDLAVEEVTTAPALDPAALVGFDGVLRRLGELCPAVLPVRFGTTAADDAELLKLVAPRQEALRAALALVAGREQMTVRVLAAAAVPASPAEVGVAPDPGPAESGTSYLRRRAAARSLPAAGPLRQAVAALAVAERCQEHESPPLLGSVFHLVRRGDGEAYRAAAAAPALAALALAVGARYAVSGPWPPYAFAPEVL